MIMHRLLLLVATMQYRSRRRRKDDKIKLLLNQFFCFVFVVASSILFVEHILFRRFKIFVGFLFDFLLFILFFWFCCFQIELFVAWIIRCVCQ